jgi:hypothetical protein
MKVTAYLYHPSGAAVEFEIQDSDIGPLLERTNVVITTALADGFTPERQVLAVVTHTNATDGPQDAPEAQRVQTPPEGGKTPQRPPQREERATPPSAQDDPDYMAQTADELHSLEQWAEAQIHDYLGLTAESLASGMGVGSLENLAFVSGSKNRLAANVLGWVLTNNYPLFCHEVEVVRVKNSNQMSELRLRVPLGFTTLELPSRRVFLEGGVIVGDAWTQPGKYTLNPPARVVLTRKNGVVTALGSYLEDEHA